ncbi:MAG TPA: threonine synthase [Candidatus Omnitrophota bacterium]|nr:threonine synthase [Candidatus Omnitrophota bacterium]HQO57895.1 threonine synthase [Candidatus Omnitrophota bacterium]
MWEGIIQHYRDFMPVTGATPIVTLKEGNTPLIPADALSDRIGLKIYLKFDGCNPTGSFKDRGMTMAISKAKEKGARIVMCASTGNTSASAAAYAARSQTMRCVVLIPDGNIALGKLAQAMIHNAKVIAIKGNFDQALNLVKDITSHYPVELVNSINPFRIEGQKSAAFEICDALQDAPEFHAIPVGNAGNITAYWKGYKEYKAQGKTTQLPVMLGFQAAGAAPIVHGKIIPNPETIATAIRIGNPASWKTAEAARDESGGVIDLVTDEEILEAYKLMAQGTGVFAEPASAASVAGILKLHERGFFKSHKGARIVCTLTGHGLKDPNIAIKNVSQPVTLEPELKAILKEIGL